MAGMPVAIAGPAPIARPDDRSSPPTPQAAPSPNPYGIPDQIVIGDAQRSAAHASNDLRSALHIVRGGYNAAIGDDLKGAVDPTQSLGRRFDHLTSAAMSIVSLPDGPAALGLKFVGKQVVKGGIEQLTYYAAAAASGKVGKLIIQQGANLNKSELKVASDLAKQGHEVTALASSKVDGVKTPDFLVDGVRTELKTVSNANAAKAATAVLNAIKDATKQAQNVIVDARGQKGLPREKALSTVRDALDVSSRSVFKSVQYLGKDASGYFEFVETKK